MTNANDVRSGREVEWKCAGNGGERESARPSRTELDAGAAEADDEDVGLLHAGLRLVAHDEELRAREGERETHSRNVREKVFLMCCG